MKKFYALLILSIVLLVSCSEKQQINIAISKGSGSSGYEKYEQWINSVDADINCIDMYSLNIDSALKVMENCSGLLLSGGPDVHPNEFGKGFDTARCSIDFWRDTLEFALINKAKEMRLPVLGVCRGLQILNVAYGGSLIVDIPEDYGTEVSHQDTTDYKTFHNIKIIEGSLLANISGLKEGIVNSNHHQAIDILASTFVSSSQSDDGIIESIEWKYPNKKSFFLAVQWHPERLEKTKELSEPIAKEFLKNVKEYQKLNSYLRK